MDTILRTGACLRKVPLMLVLGLIWLWPYVASAQDDLPTITVCNDCSSGYQYADAGAQAAQFEWAGGWVPESDDVYVVNVPARQTLAYRVTRTRIDPDPFIIGDEILQLDVEPIDGDPGLLDDLAAAIDVVSDFGGAITENIPADELILPPEIDSALDLLGPEAGPGGLRRDAFERALTQYFSSFWQQQSISFQGIVGRLVNKILGQLNLPGGSAVTIVFGDGTSIDVLITAMDQDITDFEIQLRFDVLEDTVLAPGVLLIPLQAGQLDDYTVSSDDPDLAAELQELLQRLGAALVFVGGGSGGGNCTTTMSCSDDGGETRCTVTVSGC